MSHPIFQYDPANGRWIENCSLPTAEWLKHRFRVAEPAYPVDCDDRMRANIDKMVGIYEKSDILQ